MEAFSEALEYRGTVKCLCFSERCADGNLLMRNHISGSVG